MGGFRVFWIFWRGAGREEFQRDLVGLAWQGNACGLVLKYASGSTRRGEVFFEICTAKTTMGSD